MIYILDQHCGERERRSCCEWLLPFCTSGCERVVLAALPSPVQSQLLTCAAGCQRVVLDALFSPLQSRLPTCAAGWQRVVLDAALSPVQSRLLTRAAGVVDAPVSDRSSYSSCNPVLGWGLRNCRLAESCLRRCSLSCGSLGC